MGGLHGLRVLAEAVPLDHAPNAVVPVVHTALGEQGERALDGAEEALAARLDDNVEEDRIP